jgi:hypothetical protein
MSGNVRFSNRIKLTGPLVLGALAHIVTKTGEDIAEATKANMYDGHFFYSGLSRDGTTSGPASEAEKARAAEEAGEDVGTVWEQLGPLSGQVHVRTPWAGLAEFGTAHMAPRPALTPAVAQEWPAAAERHAKEEAL